MSRTPLFRGRFRSDGLTGFSLTSELPEIEGRKSCSLRRLRRPRLIGDPPHLLNVACMCEIRKFSKIFCGSSLVRMFLAKLAVLFMTLVNARPGPVETPLGVVSGEKNVFRRCRLGRRLIDVQREGQPLPAVQSALRGCWRGVCHPSELARLCGSPRSAGLRPCVYAVPSSWRAHREPCT